MSNDLFTDMPEYVRITIYAQIRSLLRTHYFRHENDTDDLLQDLLLYYLTTFHNKPVPSEAYVVASLKHEAIRLLKAKAQESFGLFVSLDDIDNNLSSMKHCDNFQKIDLSLTLSQLEKVLSKKENLILRMILNDSSLDEIAQKIHVSKNTIYGLFKKIQKTLKK